MLSEKLMPQLKAQINCAQSVLSRNKNSDYQDIAKLGINLWNIQLSLELRGLSHKEGQDSLWRPSFVAFQCILEKALLKAKIDSKVKDIECYIIAPKPPTALLTFNYTSSFRKVNLQDRFSMAALRYESMVRLLDAGCNVHALYSSEASTALANDAGYAYYIDYAKVCDELKDRPVIELGGAEFPAEMTGAIYKVDGEFIALESRQANQVGPRVNLTENWSHTIEEEIGLNYKRPVVEQADAVKNNPVMNWSISIGEQALPRVRQVSKFLTDHGAGGILGL